MFVKNILKILTGCCASRTNLKGWSWKTVTIRAGSNVWIAKKKGPPEVHHQCKRRCTSKSQKSLHLLPQQELPCSNADYQQEACTKHLGSVI